MGKNAASYKFALAKCLLDYPVNKDSAIRLEDLSRPFSESLCSHLRLSDKQGTSPSSTLLDSLRKYNQGEISEEERIKVTTELGFVNVIDAFHIVSRLETPIRFFVDERQSKNQIRLTDDFYRMRESIQYHNLIDEVEARWRLVETAWQMNISSSLISVSHDIEQGTFFIEDPSLKRTDVTSARPALNGYQKGKCFYCFSDISINGDASDMADVDHFLPHRLKAAGKMANIDGVWNLVLACKRCNRGKDGKFDRAPEIRYLERLNKRNNFLIESHHPLRETLMYQTGRTTRERIAFLNECYRHAEVINPWRPVNELSAAF